MSYIQIMFNDVTFCDLYIFVQRIFSSFLHSDNAHHNSILAYELKCFHCPLMRTTTIICYTIIKWGERLEKVQYNNQFESLYLNIPESRACCHHCSPWQQLLAFYVWCEGWSPSQKIELGHHTICCNTVNKRKTFSYNNNS